MWNESVIATNFIIKHKELVIQETIQVELTRKTTFKFLTPLRQNAHQDEWEFLLVSVLELCMEQIASNFRGVKNMKHDIAVQLNMLNNIEVIFFPISHQIVIQQKKVIEKFHYNHNHLKYSCYHPWRILQINCDAL